MLSSPSWAEAKMLGQVSDCVFYRQTKHYFSLASLSAEVPPLKHIAARQRLRRLGCSLTLRALRMTVCSSSNALSSS